MSTDGLLVLHKRNLKIAGSENKKLDLHSRIT
jgi:hypothetical protein